MDKLELLLKKEKEDYLNLQVPDDLTDEVFSLINELPDRKKTIPSWVKVLASMLVFAIITSVIVRFVLLKEFGPLMEYVSKKNNSTEHSTNNDKVSPVEDKNSLPAGEEKNTTPKVEEKNSDPAVEEKTTGNPYHPIAFSQRYFEGADFTKSVIIGGSKDGKWYTVDDFEIQGKYTTPEDFQQVIEGENYVTLDLIKEKDSLKFYTKESLVGEIKAMKPTLMIPGSTMERVITAEIPPLQSSEDILMGIDADWDAAPRKQNRKDTEKGYIIDFIGNKNPVSCHVTKNSNLDGTTEIQVSLELDNTLFPAGTYYISDTPSCNFEVFLMDLNGDTQEEVVIYSTTGHNTSVSVYETKPGKPVEVLSFYNGD